jgi:hypothetical protein
VAQLQTLLAPGQSLTYRVAFLGESKYAKAPVQASSTPGVRQSEAKPIAFECGQPLAAG